MNGGEPLLTTEQVMDRLLADARLRRLAATCVLPAIRYGSEWRFRQSDLDAWVERQCAPSVAPAVTPTPGSTPQSSSE